MAQIILRLTSCPTWPAGRDLIRQSPLVTITIDNDCIYIHVMAKLEYLRLSTRDFFGEYPDHKTPCDWFVWMGWSSKVTYVDIVAQKYLTVKTSTYTVNLRAQPCLRRCGLSWRCVWWRLSDTQHQPLPRPVRRNWISWRPNWKSSSNNWLNRKTVCNVYLLLRVTIWNASGYMYSVAPYWYNILRCKTFQHGFSNEDADDVAYVSSSHY